MKESVSLPLLKLGGGSSGEKKEIQVCTASTLKTVSLKIKQTCFWFQTNIREYHITKTAKEYPFKGEEHLQPPL